MQATRNHSPTGRTRAASQRRLQTHARRECRALLSSLSFCSLHPNEFRDPTRVGEQLAWTIADLKQADLASTLLARSILRAAIHVESVDVKVNRESIVSRNLEALTRRHPAVSFLELESTCDDVRRQPFPITARQIGQAAGKVIDRLRAILDDLASQGFVGLFAQRSGDVAAFRYGRSVLTDTVLAEHREDRTTVDERDGNWILETQEIASHKTVRREIALERHTHIARSPCHRKFPAPEIAKPDFVEQLVHFVPEYLHGTAAVVSADDHCKSVKRQVLHQSTETITSRVRRRRRRMDWRRVCDPCITLFSHRYVIVGWTPDEVHQRTL